MTRQKRPLNTLIKKIWLVLAILIIFAALVSSIFRALTPWATEYKGEVEQRLSAMLGQPVVIKTMETGWYWFNPVIKLQSVSIQDNQNKPIFLDKILVGFNVLGSLWHWQIEPGILYIDQVHLVLRKKAGLWQLDGFSQASGQMNQIASSLSPQILAWLSQQDKLIVRHVSADLYQENNDALYVREMDFELARQGQQYRLRGKAGISETKDADAKITHLRLMADAGLNFSHPDKSKGQMYIAATNFQYSQAKFLFPQAENLAESGQGDVELWLDLSKGELAGIQSRINLQEVSIKKQKMDTLAANLAWEVLPDGWNLSADHMKLQIQGDAWPENTLFLHYDKSADLYFVYLKNLIVEKLLATKSEVLANIPLLLQAKPAGNLADLQIKTQNGHLVSLLTRFDKLSWQNVNAIPGVDNCSGVIQYQPDSGRLELDSENTKLHIKGYPEQHFSLINAALAWKLSDKHLQRLDIERLEISQPDLALSILGSMDWLNQTLGYTQLTLDFSGKHLEQWIKYIPSKWLKPDLDTWLKKDIRQIAQASGRVNFMGFGQDFPFDAKPGEFTIASHLQGFDLRVDKNWPYIEDAELYLNVNKRSLQADIVQAKLTNALVKSMHLQVDDIGKDKETLIIDTKIQDQARFLLEYLQHSPVARKITLLKNIRIAGLLSMILHIEAPLYAGNEDVLVKGNLIFDKNTLIFKYPLGSVQLDNLSGNLPFSEQAPESANLQAFFLDSPLAIRVSPAKDSRTMIDVSTNMSVPALKNQLKTPLLSLFSGDFNADLRFIINQASNVLESVSLKTALQGTSIALPTPLGKPENTAKSLEVNLDLKTKNLLKIEVNYADVLQSDLSFDRDSKVPQFKSGIVRIGKTHAALEALSGLQVVGTLAVFDLQEWQKVLDKIASNNSDQPWIKNLNYVDLFFEKFKALDHEIKDLALKITPLKAGDWGLKIKQVNLRADLIYTRKVNTLSGQISEMHLPKPSLSGDEAEEDKLHLKPGQIPNLNLRIDNLQLGDLRVGDITLNTKSGPRSLELTWCKIQTPGYTMNLQGVWHQENKRNKTDIQASLIFNNLAKTLEHWAITPAADASKGEAEFKGSWAGPIYDFSLQKLDGQLSLTLKHGRITDLSPETEQKLGLGKLLSILSLQTLPRRLTLDFSDLSQKGYSFDIFKGNFNLTKGILNTQDSYIDGPVAYASMKGELNLVQRLYDLELGISPHVAASLPVVATLAGGPVAGAAAWVVGKIINQGMHKVSAYTYKISGPWSHPVVQQISIIKKK